MANGAMPEKTKTQGVCPECGGAGRIPYSDGSGFYERCDCRKPWKKISRRPGECNIILSVGEGKDNLTLDFIQAVIDAATPEKSNR